MGTDAQPGKPNNRKGVFSLYGSNFKRSGAQLEDDNVPANT